MPASRGRSVRKRSTKQSREGAPDTARLRGRFERLLAAGVAIFSEHSLERVLQQIADSACEVVGARYAALGVLGHDGVALTQFVTSGLSEAARQRIGDLPRGRGLLGLVIREAKPIRSTDISRHPKRFGFPPHHPPMKSFLGVPIRSRGALFGNLYLTEKIGAKQFDREDEAIAVLLAAHAAVAVEKARLYDESQRLVGQVQAMQRARELFTAMMNHELRNALTGVYGWAERLVRGKAPEQNARAAREVYEGAERTVTLLNNFLDLARLDAGRVQPVWRDVAIAVAVERAMAGVEPAAEAKRIRLAAAYADGAATLRTDPVRLEQILVNLLSNAVRHSPEGETVAVRVEQAKTHVRFRVIDHGPGVAPEIQQRIFEPFERFDPHSGLGTGLGLPVSRGLAELMGGSLTVESVVGGGAGFALTLPLGPPDAV